MTKIRPRRGQSLVTEFFSDWLALREPADVAARSVDLTSTLIARLNAVPPREPLRILDLGTGTGSNVRYLMPRLPPNQRWTLIDNDADLLKEGSRKLAGWAQARGYDPGLTDDHLWVGAGLDARIETRRQDLQPLDTSLFTGQDVVTGSALLDLVSDRWLHELAAVCAANRAAVLFALTYTGETRCTPEEPEDDRITALMNRHQRSDKGFGAAAGPDAADRAALAFEQAGYVVHRAKSDWNLGPETAPLQTCLFEGWERVATVVAPEDSATHLDWLGRRLAHLAAGRSQVMVSHEDLVAWPKENSS